MARRPLPTRPLPDQTSHLPPSEGLRGSSGGSCALPARRQLPLQALGEGEGADQPSSLLPTPPAAWSRQRAAQVKLTHVPQLLSGGRSRLSCLFRFRSRRRLLLLSAPSEEDHSLQQQLSALSGQECPLGQSRPPGSVLSSDIRNLLEVLVVFLRLPSGVRHFAALQMTGVGDEAKGSVQLFPLNGGLGGPRGWGGGGLIL